MVNLQLEDPFFLSVLPFPNRTLLFTTRLSPFSFIFLGGVADTKTTGRFSQPPSRRIPFFNLLFPFASFVRLFAASFLMPIATSPSALPRPATFAKMEDRKRPASGAVDDGAPPSKRQAVNGSSKSKDDSGDAKEEAWIEVSLSHDIPCVIISLQALP